MQHAVLQRAHTENAENTGTDSKPPREHGAAFLTACERFANLETKAVEFA
jgi:hypothetical protein